MKKYNRTRVRKLHEAGLTNSEIASKVGCARNTVLRILDPELEARHNLKSAQLKRLRTGTCVDCGAETKYSGKGGIDGVSERCVRCADARRSKEITVWTRELIVHRIIEWSWIYGEPPAQADWNAYTCRQRNDPERARRAQDPHWPHSMTVIKKLGTWNEAIKAAGFEGRVPHGGGGNELRRRKGVEI